MQSELNKPINLGISVWVSPVEETWYEPAWILTYDDEGLAIRSATGYAAGQEILIGMESPRNKNGRHGIEALLKVKIFWRRQIEKENASYFKYQAKYVM